MITVIWQSNEVEAVSVPQVMLRGALGAMALSGGILVLDEIGFSGRPLHVARAVAVGFAATILMASRRPSDRGSHRRWRTLFNMGVASIGICLAAEPLARLMAGHFGFVSWWADIEFEPSFVETARWAVKSSWSTARYWWLVSPAVLAMVCATLGSRRLPVPYLTLATVAAASAMSLIVHSTVYVQPIDVSFFLVRLPLLTALTFPCLDYLLAFGAKRLAVPMRSSLP